MSEHRLGECVEERVSCDCGNGRTGVSKESSTPALAPVSALVQSQNSKA